LTPNIIGELQNAVGEASDSDKIAMEKDETVKVFRDLIMDIENQYARVGSPPGGEPYPGSYYYPLLPWILLLPLLLALLLPIFLSISLLLR
jgi:hypothetical protein